MPGIRALTLFVSALIALGCQQGQSKLESYPRTWESEGYCVAAEQTEDAANADFANGLIAPETGDGFNATCNATLPALFQQVGDREQALARVTPGAGTSVTVRVPLVALYNTSDRFTGSPGQNRWLYSQGDIASAGALLFSFPSNLPKSHGKIASVTAVLKGDSHSALPATKPTLTLYRNGRAAGGTGDVTATSVGTQTDAAASAGAYDVVHTITIAALNHTLVADNDYFIKFTGEASTNAQLGLILYAIDIEMTP
jgi:hypothetical protein